MGLLHKVFNQKNKTQKTIQTFSRFIKPKVGKGIIQIWAVNLVLGSCICVQKLNDQELYHKILLA